MNINECGCRPYGWLGLDGDRCIRVIPRQEIPLMTNSSLFQVTPPLGVLCVLGIIFVVKEPPRGASEGGNHLSNTAWLVDLRNLIKKYLYLPFILSFCCDYLIMFQY